MRPQSETVEHVGEWKVALAADTLEELFGEAARVIARAVGPTGAPPGAWERVALAARDLPTLLVDWTNELLGRSEASGMAYAEVRNVRVRVRPSGTAEVSAMVRGSPVEEWRSPIKAATYHAPTVTRDDGPWRATLLLDV